VISQPFDPLPIFGDWRVVVIETAGLSRGRSLRDVVSAQGRLRDARAHFMWCNSD